MRFSTWNHLLSLNPSSGDHDWKKLKFNPPGGASSFSFSDRMVLKKKLIKYFLSIYSCQNLTSLWPHSTLNNHILKKTKP